MSGRDPASQLHRPVAALRRIQDLAGQLRAAAGDRNPHRAAQIDSISRELFDVAVAALCGGPLPEPRDHERSI